MNDILLADSDKDVLEKKFKVTQIILNTGHYRLLQKKIQREVSLSCFGYKFNQHKIQPSMQVRPSKQDTQSPYTSVQRYKCL